MKRPTKGWDVVRRQYEVRKGSGNNGNSEIIHGEEYGVFAADAAVPLVMVLYKVV
jgi:hypothetical protein